MKSYITIAGLLWVTFFVQGCSKQKDDTTPSGISDTYTVPQGNHGFDTTIVNYYNRYGSYLLYQFTDKDIYWTPTSYTKPVVSSYGSWSLGIDYTFANTDDIPAQLDLIQKQWFSYYTDTFLKRFLPVKIFLCGSVDSIYTGYVFSPSFAYIKGTQPVAAYYSYDNIAVNFGSDTVTTFTDADKLHFMARVNSEFIKSITGRSLSTPSVTFSTVASYASTYSSQAAAYAQGIITTYYNTLSAQADWNAYMLAMVTYSDTQLNAAVANYDMTPAGMLNVMKDTNGKIKQRYDMVRNYFINTYNVDLQKIGNAANGQ